MQNKHVMIMMCIILNIIIRLIGTFQYYAGFTSRKYSAMDLCLVDGHGTGKFVNLKAHMELVTVRFKYWGLDNFSTIISTSTYLFLSTSQLIDVTNTQMVIQNSYLIQNR